LKCGNFYVPLRVLELRFHMVLIHADGIDWRGQRYRSLSVVARKITGARWSGPRFFGLRQRPLVLDSRSRAGESDGQA
jgi:Protein of unknown function (DUF2924)